MSKSQFRFIVAFVIVVVTLGFLMGYSERGRSHHDRVMRAYADQRSLAMCLESYYLDHKSYPAAASGVAGTNNIPDADSDILRLSTFRVKTSPNDPIHTLTTPVSYCETYHFTDPWAKIKRATFGYYTANGVKIDGTRIQGWLLWSAGPDRDYDIDPQFDYDPAKHPIESLIDKTYDPTNGQKSNGDIWRAKQ